MNILFKAIDFMSRAHGSQLRKGTNMPYVMHPFSVGMHLQKIGCSDTVIVSGLLHDVLEDTDTEKSQIQKEFGTEVLQIIEACTDDKNISWKLRKEAAINKYQTATFDVCIVSLCDKFHNLSSIVSQLQSNKNFFYNGHFNGYKEKYIWYYQSIFDTFSNRKHNDHLYTLFVDYKKIFYEFKELNNYYHQKL